MGYALEHPKPLNYRARGRYAIHYFEEGEVIFRECERAQGLYRIRSGTAKVIREDGQGKEHIIGILGPGDFIGMEVLLGDAFYRMSVVAMEDLSAYFLTPAQVKQLMDMRPSLYGRLIEDLQHLLARAEEITVPGDNTDSRQRLAGVLLELYRKFGEPETGCLDLAVSQSDLANFAGISRQTFYRIIQRWEASGILARTREGLCIRMPERLEQLLA